MINKYAPARTFRADTYLRIMELWNQDCTEYHNHEGEIRETVSTSPHSSPPPSPSASTESSDSRPASPSPSPTKQQTSRGANAEKLSKEDLAFLANFRPGPGPLSPERAKQQFARVLGPQAVIPEEARGATQVGHMLYAVGGHQSIFRSRCVCPPNLPRDRTNLFSVRCRKEAFDIFQRTPGAELAFSRDAGEIWAFLGENSIPRRVLPKGVQAVPILYAVSGHRRVFQNK